MSPVKQSHKSIMSLKSILTKPQKQWNRILTYLQWITVLIYFAFDTWVTPYSKSHYCGYAVGTMIILGLLAFQYTWKPFITATLRILFFGCVKIFL